MQSQNQSRAVLFVDGPNVSFVYGNLLGRKPGRTERPRWDRILDNLDLRYQVVFDANYVVNGSLAVGDRDFAFHRYLRQTGFRVAAPKGRPEGGDGDPVDDFIRKGIDCATLKAGGSAIHVVVMSHDHGYAPHLQRLLARGGRWKRESNREPVRAANRGPPVVKE